MEEKRTKMDGQRKLTPLETLKAYHDFKQFRKYMYVAIDKMPKWLKHSEGANCIVSIKPWRIYPSSRTVRKMFAKIKWITKEPSLAPCDILASVNSYFGITRHFAAFNLRKGAARMLFERFGRAVQFNEHYNKMIIVKSYVKFKRLHQSAR